MKNLSECREGDSVRIVSVKGQGGVRRRLLDMGFMRGTPLTIVRYAPLRDPIEVCIRDNRISLRVKEAQIIEIEMTGESNGNSSCMEDK
ncbi:MAG: ferrous iron transport protein A [Chitinispirillaceae bacterium]